MKDYEERNLEDHPAGHCQHPHGGSDRPRNHELHGSRTVLKKNEGVQKNAHPHYMFAVCLCDLE